MFIQQDLFRDEIIPRLSLKDIIRMKMACKELYSVIDQQILEIFCLQKIQNRLRNIFEEKFEDFIFELGRSEALLSGSFIIQSILDENWQNDDKSKEYIDIYVNVKNKSLKRVPFNPETKFETWLFGNLFFSSCVTVSPYDEANTFIMWVRDFAFTKSKNCINHGKPIIKLIDLNLNKTTSNVARIPKDIWEFINLTFDVDACKNAFGVKNGYPYVKINRILNKI